MYGQKVYHTTEKRLVQRIALKHLASGWIHQYLELTTAVLCLTEREKESTGCVHCGEEGLIEGRRERSGGSKPTKMHLTP